MPEAREGPQPRILLRHRDGDPVTIAYTNTTVEMNRRTGQREAPTETFVPRFNRLPAPGTLIEIPLGRGEYFMADRALPGQKKPGSVYGKRLSRAKFQELKSTPGITTVIPDNLPVKLKPHY